MYEKEIVRHFGTFGKTKTGWSKEVNEVSWNGKEPKIDVKVWSPDYSTCSKITTLTDKEAEALGHILLEAVEERKKA